MDQENIKISGQIRRTSMSESYPISYIHHVSIYLYMSSDRNVTLIYYVMYIY